MANFNTHVGVAAAASAAFVSLAAGGGLVDAIDVPWYIFLGIVGGMLPDIDADNSTPLKRLFTLLSGMGAAAAWTISAAFLEPRYQALAAAGGFLIVRFPVFHLFQLTTVHRGVFHSLLGAIFFGLLTTCICDYFLHWNVLQAWLSGVFLVFGFIVHLCLDEMFSVDLANGRMKKSFGTAMKLYSYNDLTASFMLLLGAAILFAVAPPSQPLVSVWARVQWSPSAWTTGLGHAEASMRSGMELFETLLDPESD